MEDRRLHLEPRRVTLSVHVGCDYLLSLPVYPVRVEVLEGFPDRRDERAGQVGQLRVEGEQLEPIGEAQDRIDNPP